MWGPLWSHWGPTVRHVTVLICSRLGNLWPHRAWTEKDDEANVVGRDLKGASRETHDVKPLMNTSLQ